MNGLHNKVPARPKLSSGIVHSHFNVHGIARQLQLLAWRARVGHIVDVPPARVQVDAGFCAAIDRYEVGDLVFTDCRTDPLPLERSVARISTDAVRDYVFHVFPEGGMGTVSGFYPQRSGTQSVASILALDMNQPVRMQRDACRVLTFFAPRALVDSALPDAESIHGRVIENTTPLTRLIVEQVAAINRNLANMSANEADDALRGGVQLMVAAFGKQAKLSGNARAAARAAMFGQVRRFIDAHLDQADLSPESLLNTLRLPRRTLYRMFEHEGGLDAFIRNRRLRQAADELVQFPQLTVKDIAYGLSFKSASDFTRAFRRAYGMSPQDLREQALELRRAQENSTGSS